jgi:hypothetical protein
VEDEGGEDVAAGGVVVTEEGGQPAHELCPMAMGS